MAHQSELDKTYLGVARLHQQLSKAIRLKVGACLVLDSKILIPGVNGLPKQLGNECEYVDPETGELITKPEVIHAEQNCLNKAAVEGVSTRGSTLYVTHSPCRHCASNMVAAGIKEVIYSEDYRDTEGISILSKSGVKVRQFKERD